VSLLRVHVTNIITEGISWTLNIVLDKSGVATSSTPQSFVMINVKCDQLKYFII
jgi:hypothetical protein